MSKGKTGTQTTSIVNTNNVKKVKCNCTCCYHSVNNPKVGLYCKYYDLFNPHKTQCARYSYQNKKNDKRLKPISATKKAPTYPWEHS